MKYFKIFIFIIFLIISSKISAQTPAYSGGIAFSSGLDLNGLNTGNPAIFARCLFKLSKQMKLVPSIAAYRPIKKYYPADAATLKNFMFQGDVDLHYNIYRDDPLRIVAFAGLNATSVISKWYLDQNLGQVVENINKFQPGLNLGGAIYMFVNNSFDAYISGKYIAGNLSQVVINVGVIFYPEGLRRKGGW